MKKRIFLTLILAVVCMIALGVTIYTKKPKDVITENDVETYYLYEETELGTELNPSSENYIPTEITADEAETVSDIIDHSAIPFSEEQKIEEEKGIAPWESVEPTEINPDKLADIFGIPISLPENPNWIVNSEYHLINENNLEITYHDSIIDSDCVILAARDEELALPENEYDESLNESWEGRTINNQNIVIKVQRGKNDGKTVLATWEYNEYRFAIIGEIEDERDAGPIAKVALSIIYELN